MQEVLVGVGKALTSLAGPVGRFAMRRSAAKHLAQLQTELAHPSSRAVDMARGVVSELTDHGLTQRDLIDLAAFCRSDEGDFCFRLICINVIAGNPLKDRASSALAAQLAAMIRLHLRNPGYAHAQVAAESITGLAIETVLPAFQTLRKRDPELAVEVRELAIQQGRLPEIFKAEAMSNRARNIESLATKLPSEIEDDIRHYAHLVASDNDSLSINAVGKSVTVNIEQCLINAGVHHRSGEIFETPSASEGSILPSMLAQHPRLVLLGDPGGGKSTAVKAAVNEYAQACQTTDSTVVPFVVILRRFARALAQNVDLGLVPFIQESFAADHDQVLSVETIRFLLHTGRAVVFFDGLDEILNLEARQHVADKIVKFSRQFSGASLVVTSREIGYDQVPIEPGFEHLSLDSFETTQVHEYAGNLFTALRTEERDEDELLERFMLESSVIADIRQNPLMLSILCFLFASGRTMPTNRLELYRRCADLLFDVWDESRGISAPLEDASAASQALREVSLAVFESGEEEMSGELIKESLARFYTKSYANVPEFRGRSFADEVFDAWTGRKWILTFAGEYDGLDHFRFAHRTFMEFFAAEQIAYECETTAEAWNRVRAYILTGSATPLCQLVVQILSSRTRGGADRFLAIALDEIEDSNVDARFNALSFASATLAGQRTEPETRDRVMQSCLRLLAELVPWISHQDMLNRVEAPFLGYTSVLSDIARSDGDIEKLGGILLDGDLDIDQETNIDAATSLLKGFAHFGELERERLLDRARAFILSRLDEIEDRDTWLRLVLLLKQVAHFEGWSSIARDWRDQLEVHGEALWEYVLDNRLVAVHSSDGELSVNDYWLNLAALRDQGTADPEALRVIGVAGLFVGDWPYPVYDLLRGTAAHTLCLAAFNLQVHEVQTRWTNDEVKGLVNQLWNMLNEAEGEYTMSTNESQHAPDWAVLPRQPKVGLSEIRVAVGAFLFAALTSYGDYDFCDRVVDAIDEPAHRQMLVFAADHQSGRSAWMGIKDRFDKSTAPLEEA